MGGLYITLPDGTQAIKVTDQQMAQINPNYTNNTQKVTTPTNTTIKPAVTAPATTNTTVKTNLTDVINTFQRYYGRKPKTSDMTNINFLTQFDPVTVEARLKATAPKASEIIKKDIQLNPSAGDNISQGSDKVAGTITKNTNDMLGNIAGLDSDKTLDEIMGRQTFEQTTSGKAELQSLKDLVAGYGIMTEADQKLIDEEQTGISSKFDELIAEAQEKKRQGMAVSTVAAGEAGGFMNTQFAGKAALTPLEASSFVGAGGKLEEINSAYDKNIEALKTQKIIALAAAKRATQEYIKTGQKDKIDLAEKAFDKAKSAYDEANNLITEKIDMIQKITDYKTKLLNSKYDLNQKAYTEASQKLQNMAVAGAKFEQLTPDEVKAYEVQLGLPSGGLEGFYKELTEIQELNKTDRKLEAASKITDLLNNVPSDMEIDIDGQKFKGYKAVETKEEETASQILDIESKKLDIQKKLQELYNTDLPAKTITQVDSLSKGFDSHPIVKQFNEVQNKKLTFDKIISRGTGPSDLSAIFDFMKSLDPDSVVRESEYATAAASGNVFLGALAKFNALFKEGGSKLPQSVRDEFKAIIDEKFAGIESQYENLYSETVRKINNKTGMEDGSEYLTNYNYTKTTPVTSSEELIPEL